MGLLSKLKEANKAVEIEEATDSLGGSIIESGLYNATIKVAYHKLADSGANAIVFQFALDNGREFTSTEFITSGKEKGCKHYYTDKNGNNKFLPGFTVAEDIAQFAADNSIFDLDAEEKVLPIYNYELKKDVPTQVNVYTCLAGKKVQLGILNKKENKSVKGNDGSYVKTADTRNVNEINKVFNEDGFTQSELRAHLDAPVFKNKWTDKYAGQEIDRVDTSIKGGSAAGASKGKAAAAIEEADDIFSED